MGRPSGDGHGLTLVIEVRARLVAGPALPEGPATGLEDGRAVSRLALPLTAPARPRLRAGDAVPVQAILRLPPRWVVAEGSAVASALAGHAPIALDVPVHDPGGRLGPPEPIGTDAVVEVLDDPGYAPPPEDEDEDGGELLGTDAVVAAYTLPRTSAAPGPGPVGASEARSRAERGEDGWPRSAPGPGPVGPEAHTEASAPIVVGSEASGPSGLTDAMVRALGAEPDPVVLLESRKRAGPRSNASLLGWALVAAGLVFGAAWWLSA
jgi:hypothetical protein